MTDDSRVLAAVRSGDEAAFGAIADSYRRQLHIHCYRMLGSVDDADDLVQETMLRAWRSRTTFEGRSSFRNWLYRIVRAPRRITTPDVAAPTDDPRTIAKWAPELPWIEPYPDALLEPAAPRDEEPEAMLAARETIQLVYMAAIQHLPPRQRAVLILCDALDWSAKEAAALLDMSLSSVNSALHRARSTMRDILPRNDDESQRAGQQRPTNEETELLAKFMDAFERADADALSRLLREDAKLTMPPALLWFDGKESVMGLYRRLLGPDSFGDFRLVATSANTLPAAVAYLRARGKTEFRLTGLNVLRAAGGEIVEITAFRPDLCAAFELPGSLP